MPTPPELRIATDRIVEAALNAWLLASPESEFRRIVEAELGGAYKAGQDSNCGCGSAKPANPQKWPCHMTKEEYMKE